MRLFMQPWPCFTDEEIQAAAAVIASNRVNYWTGEEGRAFEASSPTGSGSAKAIAMANGTLALEAALKALEIGPGDEVIVTPRTFIASVSCVVNEGATPVFADIDPDSGNIIAGDGAGGDHRAHAGDRSGAPGRLAVRHGRA